jgi:hypothetical protein
MEQVVETVVSGGQTITANFISLLVLLLQAKIQKDIADLKVYMHINFEPKRNRHHG